MAEADRQDLQELAGLVAELRAWSEWSRACGMRVAPRGGVEPVLSELAPEPRLQPRPAEVRPRAMPPEPRPVEVRPPPRPTPPDPRPTPDPEPRVSAALPSQWAAVMAARRVPPAEPVAASVSPAAGLVRTLDAVRAELGDCRRCRLCEQRKNLVFGVGSPAARLVIVGEAPGAREDELGEPFVGAAGEMLDRMLENVLKLRRDQVYILNVVKCRPPGNRDPQPDEVAACKPFLLGQIEALNPAVLLAVGRVAAQSLMETSRGINALRGEWHLFQGRVPLMATFHPAYLLRMPDDKRKTLEDLIQVRDRLAQIAAG